MPTESESWKHLSFRSEDYTTRTPSWQDTKNSYNFSNDFMQILLSKYGQGYIYE